MVELEMDNVVEKGWRSGESTRLPPMWPEFKSRRQRRMWVEFVFGSLPCSERFFSGYSGFPLYSKTNNSTRNQVDEEPLCATRKSLCIYLFIYLMFMKGNSKFLDPSIKQKTVLYFYDKCVDCNL